MAVQIQFRRDIAAAWTSANPTLAEGELGLETDTGQFKVGNGVDSWTVLSYSGAQGPTGPPGAAGPLTPVAHSNILIENNYQFPNNKNGISVGPVTIDNNATVTVPENATWLIVPEVNTDPFFLNSQIVLESFVVPVGFNAGTFGPVSLATGAVVTVPSGSVWTIV